ncbi:anosmin-1 isoform X2 [Condylostylus longicornis]|uniref:anosmin-1 isoform X2 n=1 Tax=Condylostylus longicornis TaxID=2530218 RepID=UPI00244DD74D|nr:anosmin-1 isoform X2 [Condylostylus longicornis]
MHDIIDGYAIVSLRHKILTRIMIFKKLTILSFLFQATVLQTTFDNYAESKRREDVDENLLRKRCELINYGFRLDNISLAQCIKNLTKPGHCPSTSYDNREYYGKMICLETCQGHDYKCPGTQKCCHQIDCGMICQEPNDLHYDNSIPPIPRNLVPRNLKKKGRTCELFWDVPLIHAKNHTGHFLYIVECRWHFGTQFSPRKLREWEWLDYEITGHILTYRTSVKRMHARIKLKRGRFYQFRVAMINENGFKGYSEPSAPFRLHDDPRPPKAPKSFKITLPKLLPNNSIYAKVTWLPNKSDIPIEKYHISWALYIKAENNSLLLNDAFVKEPIHSYEFWNLHPNSMYYIQVQAIAVHGKRRPKSPKSSIFYNTTIETSNSLDHINSELSNNQYYNRTNHYVQQSSASSSINSNIGTYSINSTGYNIIGKSKNTFYSENNFHSNSHMKQPIITIKFLPNKKYGLLVRAVFSKDTNNEKYLLELCPGNFSNCESKEYEAAKTKKDQIDFSQLKFNKQYTLRLIDTTNHIDVKGDGIVLTKTFLTPACSEWLKKHPNLKTNFKC